MARFYYPDGVIHEGEKPPARGVQVIAQEHPYVGTELVTGGDYYILEANGLWRAVDIFGLFDFLLDSGIVVFGRTVTKDEYSKIVNQAIQDKEKAGWTTGERKPD